MCMHIVLDLPVSQSSESHNLFRSPQMLPDLLSILAFSISVSEELRRALNIVHSSANIPLQILVMEGRTFMEQLKMVGPRTLTLRNSCSDVPGLRQSALR